MQREYWLSLLARRGFAAVLRGNKEDIKYIYLPLGSTLRRNIVHEWLYNVVTKRENVHLLEGPLMRRKETKLVTGLSNLCFAKDYWQGRERNDAELAKMRAPLVQCKLTKKELKQIDLLPLELGKQNKLVLQASSESEAKEWTLRIKQDLTKDTKMYRRSNKIFLPVHEITSQHIVFHNVSGDGEGTAVEHCGQVCSETGSPFLQPVDNGSGQPLSHPTIAGEKERNCENLPSSSIPGESVPGGIEKGLLSRSRSGELSLSGALDGSEPQRQEDSGGQSTSDCSAHPKPSFRPYILQTSAHDVQPDSPLRLRTDLTEDILDGAGMVAETMDLSVPFAVASVGASLLAALSSQDLWREDSLLIGTAITGSVFRDVTGSDRSLSCLSESLKEFAQMQMLYFCHSAEARDAYVYWQNQRLRWWKQYSDDPERFSLEEKDSSQLLGSEVHSSVVKFEVPWYSTVVERVTSYQPSPDGTCTVRTAAGLDRGFWALLADAHWNRFPEELDNQVLRLNEMLAPVKVAVVVDNPDDKNQILLGRQLSLELKTTEISTRFRYQGTAGDNYIKEDESGTPYCVLVNDATLSSGVLGFRHRNNGLTEYIHKDDLLQSLYPRLRRHRFFKPM